MNKKFIKFTKYTTIAAFAVFGFYFAKAQQFDSSSYRISDPVISPGGYSSSENFKISSVLYQVSMGTSSSSGFKGDSGFGLFPLVTSPIVTATGAVTSVNLSWTPAVGFLGWNVGGYNILKSTVSGGPYSYTPVGNITTYSATSLTAGSTYYFRVVVKDSLGNPIATSTEVSAVPTAASTPVTPPPASGGGGGGGAIISPATTVNFSGRAYPRSTITLLKDAQVAATSISGSDANFQISLSGLSSGNYIFSVYTEDKDGHRSSLLSFPVSVTSGATTNVSGIFIAPSLVTDKSEVKRGDNIVIFGQSVPKSDITIVVNSAEEFYLKTLADNNGVYLQNFDTSPLEYGPHTTKSKAATSAEISSFSSVVGFTVGTKNVLAVSASKCPAKGDINGDCRVNLVDFSITAYWYKRELAGAFTQTEKDKLNNDGKVNLVDFSIMAYYWTG